MLGTATQPPFSAASLRNRLTGWFALMAASGLPLAYCAPHGRLPLNWIPIILTALVGVCMTGLDTSLRQHGWSRASRSMAIGVLVWAILKSLFLWFERGDLEGITVNGDRHCFLLYAPISSCSGGMSGLTDLLHAGGTLLQPKVGASSRFSTSFGYSGVVGFTLLCAANDIIMGLLLGLVFWPLTSSNMAVRSNRHH